MKKIMVLALCGALALTACNSSGGGSGAEEKKLVVSTFGLNEDNSIKDVYKPFEELTGSTLVTDTGTASERFTKLSSNPEAGIDIIEISQSLAADGATSGLFEAVDLSKIEHAKDLIDSAKTVADEIGGVPYVVNSVGIVYNPEAVGFEITSFDDLWGNLNGKIAIPDITTTYGPAMVCIASDYKGVDYKSDNGAVAFEALAELKPNVTKTYAKSSDVVNMFTSGEIVAAVVGDFAVPVIKDANPDMVFVSPEGAYANFNLLCVNKSSKNKDLAYEYINYRLSPELQKRTANPASLNEAPTNKMVELTAEESQNLTYGEVAANAKSLDYAFVNPLLPEWIDQWNRIINN